jgi:tetratricopeptide (TPR) repeat protein
MTPEERAAVLDALVRFPKLAAERVDPLATLLPLLGQRRALWQDPIVIVGGRGAGKTMLFHLLNDARTSARLRAFYEDDRGMEARWIDAFSQEGMKHPGVGPMAARATATSDLGLRAFWMTHLLRRVHDELPGIAPLPPPVEAVLKTPVTDIDAWLPLAEASAAAVSAALDATERALVAKDQSVVATYDDLDRVGPYEPGVRRRYVGTLLALWLSLARRYKKLHGKVFLRDDLFNRGELGFADADTLRARAQTITWDHEALYRLVVRYLAVASEPARAWLRDVPGLTLRDRGEFGWVPGEMPDEVQRAFMTKLAWRVLGKGIAKSETHTWVVNRLWDANRRVTPRAMLWFFGFAGEAAQRRSSRGWKTPLIADDLVEAIHRTSRERVDEIKEEYLGSVRMENLRGMTLPLGRDDVVARLGRPRPGEPGGLPASGEAILGELLRCGVLRPGEEGKLDVPDIYRYAFGITPDYATAWEDFLLEDKPAAREMFVRNLADLGRILRTHAEGKWGQVAKDAIDRKDYAAAREQCERALDLATSAGDAGAEADVLSQIGRIEMEERHTQRAWNTFMRALGAAKRAKDRTRQSQSLSGLGETADKTNDSASALVAYNELARLGHELKEPAAELRAFSGLSRVARTTAPAKAAEYSARALAISQNINDGLDEFIAFRGFMNLATDGGLYMHARRLAALADVVFVRSVGLNEWKGLLATFTDITPEEIDALRKQAAEAYARDRGWGIIREAFPDLVLPPPDALPS